MKKFFCCLFLAIIIPALVSCAEDSYSEPVYQNNDQFQPTGQTFAFGDDMDAHVFEDTKTHYLYLVTTGGHQGGICIWLDENGQPQKRGE